ncbi:MAG: ATP-binding protein [Anaerolineales bacterium]|nr:ATP-binding protein [Anaerolineales bacterium]
MMQSSDLKHQISLQSILRIAITSGKGGTGKTTIALSLASISDPRSTVLLDCDVEVPNVHLFLDFVAQSMISAESPIPQVNQEKCTLCGKCSQICEFHAITTLGNRVIVFPELCHSCGSCILLCPEKALSEINRKVGKLSKGRTKEGMIVATGELNPGEPMAVPVIRQLKQWVFPQVQEAKLMVFDSPPGTSCSMVEVLSDVDYVILVTEPTPFGLHDLDQAVKATRRIGKPMGVILNKTGLGTADIHSYCQEQGLPLLMEIPLDQEIASALASGALLTNEFPEYRGKFISMLKDIDRHLHQQKEEVK